MNKKFKRILYVSPKLRYSNPTSELLPVLLNQVGQLECFGPGFVSEEQLSDGLEKFVDKRGPFDFAVSNELVILVSSKKSVEHLLKRIPRIYSFDFPKQQIKYLKEMSQDWKKIKISKGLSLLQDDLYGWTKQHRDLALKTLT